MCTLSVRRAASSQASATRELTRLRFLFEENYPIEAPEVVFVGRVPDHQHVYSNGFICMSILYDGWSAAMNVGSVVRTLVSMLASAERKVRPHNDKDFIARAKGKTPKDFYWTYDDDKC